MNRRNVFAGVTLAALVLLGAEVRAQTVYGANGMLIHPTALVSPRQGIGANVSWFTEERDADGRTTFVPVSISYESGASWSAGAMYLNRRRQGRSGDSGGVFGKYQLRPDSERAPAVALAGSYIDGDLELKSAAAVVSHTFLDPKRDLPGITAHLGVQWVRRSDIATPASDTIGFLGLEVPIARDWRLTGEIGSKTEYNDKSQSAVAIVWNRRGASVAVGLINAGRSDRHQLFIGVGYPLGGDRVVSGPPLQETPDGEAPNESVPSGGGPPANPAAVPSGAGPRPPSPVPAPGGGSPIPAPPGVGMPLGGDR